MANLTPFTLREPSLEELGRRLGQLYAHVSLSRDPMFSWVQIINDVTILGEDLRRTRDKEAVQRAGKVLIRLLEFIGYYSYVHTPSKRKPSFADHVATNLRLRSYSQVLARSLQEGPTRWILAKYPYACSKCGRRPCHCAIAPWVLENRREQPEEYIRRFKVKAEAARSKLRAAKPRPFSILTLLEHFRKVYRNSYYNQEPWKIGMHLSEEIGEATTELSRMQLQWLAQRSHFRVASELPRIFAITRDKIDKEVRRINNGRTKATRKDELNSALMRLEKRTKTAPWKTFESLVSDKFKEEIADVFSWLAAIIVKLDPDLKVIGDFPKRFDHQEAGGVSFLGCPWCLQACCSDACLVTDSISSEMTENLSKF